MDLARDRGQYAVLDVQDGDFDLRGNPRIIEQLGCTRALIRHLEQCGVFRDPTSVLSKALLTLGILLLATLASLVSSVWLGKITVPTNTLTVTTFVVASLNLAAILLRSYLIRSTRGSARKELADLIRQFVTNGKHREECEQMIRICAERLTAAPRIVIVDSFSRLDHFTREVLLTTFVQKDLRPRCALIAIVIDSERDVLNTLAATRGGASQTFSDVACFSIEPLGVDERRALCVQAGVDERLATTSASLTEIMHPGSDFLKQYARQQTEDAQRLRDRRNPAGEFVITVEDVLRVGHCRHGARIDEDDLQRLCSAGSGLLRRLARDFDIVRLSRETAEAQLRQLREDSPQLFEGGNVRLDWLHDAGGIPAEVVSIVKLAWADHWLHGATNKGTSYAWLRVGIELAAEIDWGERLTRSSEGQTALLRFFEVSRRAIQECFRVAMLAEAAALSRSITRAWADVGQFVRERNEPTARRLEQILYRTVWESMAVTLSREQLTDAMAAVAQNTHPEPEAKEAEAYDLEPNTWWDWFLRLTGVHVESLRVARRILLGESDSQLSRASKWVIWAGLYFECANCRLEMDAGLPLNVIVGMDVGSHLIGDAIPSLNSWTKPGYWENFIDTKEDELHPVTVLSVMAMAVRCAMHLNNPREALEGMKWLFEAVRDFDQPGHLGETLNRAMLLESRSLALEVVLANAIPETGIELMPENEEGGVRFKRKRIPARIRPVCLELLRLVDEDLAASLQSQPDGLVPFSWFDRIDSEYLELALLWKQLGLYRREAWCKIWRVRFMVRESDASPANTGFASRHLVLLQEAAKLVGVHGYAADALGIKACRDYRDFAASYRYRLASRAWNHARMPHLAVAMTFNALQGGRTALAELSELSRTVLDHMGFKSEPSGVWNSIDTMGRFRVFVSLAPVLMAFRQDEECEFACRVIRELAQKTDVEPEYKALVDEWLKLADLVSQFRPDEENMVSEWLEKWDHENDRRLVGNYAVELWKRASVRQRRAAFKKYLLLLASLDRAHDKDWLASNIVPDVGVSGVEDGEDISQLQEWVRGQLRTRRRGMSAEMQIQLAGFYRRTNGSDESLVNEILNAAERELLDRVWMERVQGSIHRNDPLAILLIYYNNLVPLGIPVAVKDRERHERLSESKCGDAFAEFAECPPVVVKLGNESRVCVDFFDLASQLVASRDSLGEHQNLLNEARQIAAESLDAFLEIAISATRDLKDVSRLLIEHKAKLAASYRFDRYP